MNRKKLIANRTWKQTCDRLDLGLSPRGSSGSTAFLEATGLPLGLFCDAEYEARTAVMSQGSSLLMFSDGLPNSIQGEQPENRLCDAFAESAGRTMTNLKSLIDPKFNEDDVTILLAKRIAGSSSGLSA
jgi:serine phosphatase RsbU (regulator of sigma subunit)